MAKRYGALGQNATKKMSHPHKTKKRRAVKQARLAAQKKKR